RESPHEVAANARALIAERAAVLAAGGDVSALDAAIRSLVPSLLVNLPHGSAHVLVAHLVTAVGSPGPPIGIAAPSTPEVAPSPIPVSSPSPEASPSPEPTESPSPTETPTATESPTSTDTPSDPELPGVVSSAPPA